MVKPITDIQPSLEVNFSNETLLLISLLGFTFLFAALACLCHLSPSQAKFNEGGADGGGSNNAHDDDEYNQLLQDADVSTLNRAQRKARARLIMKKNKQAANEHQQRIAAEGAAAAVDGNDGGDGNNANVLALDEGGNDQEGDNQNNDHGPKLSRKERQKAAKEEERLYRREYEEMRKLKIKNEVERREAKEQLLKEKKEVMEQERREMQEEELKSWKYMFGGENMTVREFVKELKEAEFIDLQETANRFNVSTESLVSRLRSLEKEGRINHGILDEKSRIYFYVSAEDMAEIANFIRRKESASLDEINFEVSRLILKKKRKVTS